MYAKAKGNVFRNKRVLVENVFKLKAERAKERQVADQAAARKLKVRDIPSFFSWEVTANWEGGYEG